MLAELLRAKKRRVIAVILGLVLILGIIIYLNCRGQRDSSEQAVMAENYLESGNYNQAVQAYKTALTLKNADRGSLSLGLAQAYAGKHDYNSALEVLRSCYQDTSDNRLKEMIEEVTANKQDYEYNQRITVAEVYYKIKDYNKAIAEYQEAKKINRKEITPYQRIAQAYMEQGMYEKAREEILDGQELTGDESFDEQLVTVNACLAAEQYELMLSQAEEYINQENYKDGIEKYKNAILYLPEEKKAYQALAEVYIARSEYDNAVYLLQSAPKLSGSKELKELLKEARTLRKQANE